MASLNYQRFGAPPDPGQRSLVLIHGIGSRWEMWRPVIDRLAAERDVVALDLPGFGRSPRLPPGSDPGARGLAEQVAGFLRDLGIERPHVVGNSLGGWVALELALAGEVSEVTAFSPAGFIRGLESLWSRTSLIASHRAARMVRPRVDGLARAGWFKTLAYWQMVASPAKVESDEVAGSIRALADAPGFDDTLRATTDQQFRCGRPLGIPVTIAWGEKDRLLWPRQASRAAAELPGARIVALPGCGHIPTYDDPELVSRVILEGASER